MIMKFFQNTGTKTTIDPNDETNNSILYMEECKTNLENFTDCEKDADTSLYVKNGQKISLNEVLSRIIPLNIFRNT